MRLIKMGAISVFSIVFLFVLNAFAFGETINKSIIIAGGDPSPDNVFWSKIENDVIYTYNTLISKGYSHDDIFFMSSKDIDVDNNGLFDNNDALLTKSNIEYAITSWASGTESVIIYMIGEGGIDQFSINESEVLYADELDTYIDLRQASCDETTILVYDGSSQSGSFIDNLLPPTGKNRIVITSSDIGEGSYFNIDGNHSFSFFFWGSVLAGDSLEEAYYLSKNAIYIAGNSLTNTCLDANGNGIINEKSDPSYLRDIYIGTSYSAVQNYNDERIKAIIVPGGGPYPGNNLWDATKRAASKAYQTLLYRGIKKENIYALSPADFDMDGDGLNNDVDGDATNANIQNAILSGVSDAETVILYFVDHGGDGTFRTNATEILQASDLGAWLNTLQSGNTADVCFIYDAVQSGSFISHLTPPSDENRLIIASTRYDEAAYFMGGGLISFSQSFWTSLFKRKTLHEAFVDASSDVSSLQNPQLEANGNGISNESEDYDIADEIWNFLFPSPTKQDKAIILVGGGQSDILWDKFNGLGKIAYRVLVDQEYIPGINGTICYLSPDRYIDLDGDGQADEVLGADASKTNLQNALSWAEDAANVLLYFVDHGGLGSFKINESSILSVSELDGWLDNLQMVMEGKVVFLYEACHSGSFIPDILSPSGKDRIIVTSTTSAQEALISGWGGEASFSYYFWTKMMLGESFYDSYVQASNIIGMINMTNAGQSPQLDADNDGNPGQKNDRTIAAELVIGNQYSMANDMPYIGSFSPVITLNDSSGSTIYADGVIDLSGVSRVWSVISPPNYNVHMPFGPIYNYPVVDLNHVFDSKYETIYDQFDREGEYEITIFAEDVTGVISYPRSTRIIRTHVNDSYIDSDIVVLNDKAQHHDFQYDYDEDWFKFYAIEGENYQIEIDEVELNGNPVIHIYNTDGTTQIETHDLNGYGSGEELLWECQITGVYFIKVNQYDGNTSGEYTGYDIAISHDLGQEYGYLSGFITDGSGNGISDALITSGVSNETTLSQENGFYKMLLQYGNHSIYLSQRGYYSQIIENVVVESEENVDQDVVLVEIPPIKGDINADGNVDQMDIDIIENVLVGKESQEIRNDYIESNIDVNGDDKIGMEEMIYIHEVVEGLR